MIRTLFFAAICAVNVTWAAGRLEALATIEMTGVKGRNVHFGVDQSGWTNHLFNDHSPGKIQLEVSWSRG